MRFNTNVSANSKKSIELNNFLGVDFSSAPTNVSKNRASFSKNLINVDGVNQKRPGWEELFNFGEDAVINGIFINKFKRHGEIDEIILVQVDGDIYRIENNDGLWESIKISSKLSFKNKDFKSSAFLSKNKLYIIGGGHYLVFSQRENIEPFETQEEIIDDMGEAQIIDKLYNAGDMVEYKGICFECQQDFTNGMTNPPPDKLGMVTYYWKGLYSYYQLNEVFDNTETYIPTTTIGIMAQESEDTSRSSLDKVNLLRSHRYNKLRGASKDIELGTYYLESYDNKPVGGKSYYRKRDDDKYEIIPTEELPSEFVDTSVKPNDYYEQIKAYSYKLDADNLEDFKEFTVFVDGADGKNIIHENLVGVYNKGGQEGNKPCRRFLFSEVDSKQKGYVDLKNGILYLFENLNQVPKGNDDNITVYFAPQKIDDIISNCSFGCRFGYKGRDTLFLSGNEDYQNQDFYSYTVEEDFTYFPADNIESFGSATSAIKAYLQVADGTLAVIKEPLNNEPTIYYRSVSYTINDIGATIIQFPVTQGAVGEGAVNAHTVGTLTGDNLFVSKNGIFGLTLADNIVVNERYAKERDRYIHSKLVKHDLSKAVAVVHKGRYMLAIDGVCYILDSRYRSTKEEDNDDTFAYESWYWDNIPAVCFCSYNNKLYFGSSNGGFCRFKEDSYFDESSLNIGVIEMGYVGNEDQATMFYIDNNFEDKIYNGQKVILKADINESNSNLYKYGIYSDSHYTSIMQSTKLSSRIFKIRFFFNFLNDLKIGQHIAIKKDNILMCCIVLNININDSTITIQTDGSYEPEVAYTCYVYKLNIVNKPFIVTNYNKEIINGITYNGFNLADENGELLKIGGYNKSLFAPTAICQIKKPVVASWQSAILDLGLYDYSKCLDSLSVVLSPEFHGKVRFGYETKRVTLDLMAKQITGAETEQSHHFFDFDNIDFDNFTFESAFASSYTKRIRERNINYIMFKAVMDDDKNSALMSIKVDYTLYKKNRGVR